VEEAEHVGAERRAAGGGAAQVREAEPVLEGPEECPVAEPVQKCPTGIQRSYMKRLNGVVSMIFTCTVEVRFSQMRGGANIT
jgi:hypothetical protein